MVQYPHIQKKVRAELLSEVGSQRLPRMEDMTKWASTTKFKIIIRHLGKEIPYFDYVITFLETTSRKKNKSDSMKWIFQLLQIFNFNVYLNIF